ncbi:MmgE/PrpD family protein [Musicola paradisiaca]|uniref:MmgE/PrpD family protein n=1 Tax=Musicola paradisiaca (strain Ech703) TaxID=579405 RepID=C6C3H3_MUSP7|nr:MmgE/PrpD family protein [Musicola paradisiaca]ACS87271.1 MmgE/PrpD family protein [Musicola paradisiaca Ech703]
MNNAQAQLAAFICQTRFSDFPAELVERCKRHILDTLGAALAGVDSDVYRAVDRALSEPAPETGAVLWGRNSVASIRQAALLNGVAAHMYELDDTGGCDHSGAVVLPAVLAMLPACPQPVSGQDLIRAVVIGYEVGRRVLEACGGYSPHNGAGWHSTATCGVFGAAAAAASLLRLPQEKMVAALGLAGSFSGGLWAFIHDGSQSKKLHAGRAAEGGVLAALLANESVSGPTQLFEPVWGGFLSTLAANGAQPEALTQDLGQVWKLLRCSIKPYASCRGVHSAIDALNVLLTRIDGDADAIEQISVSLSPFLHGMCGNCDLDSLAAAQMSLPYALAARLVHGHAGLNAYLDGNRQHPGIAPMLARIELRLDPQQDSDSEPLLTLTTRRGERFSHRVEIALGSPHNPLSDAALLEKFTALAVRALPEPRVRALADLCLGLEKVADVQPLAETLMLE